MLSRERPPYRHLCRQRHAGPGRSCRGPGPRSARPRRPVGHRVRRHRGVRLRRADHRPPAPLRVRPPGRSNAHGRDRGTRCRDRQRSSSNPRSSDDARRGPGRRAAAKSDGSESAPLPIADPWRRTQMFSTNPDGRLTRRRFVRGPGILVAVLAVLASACAPGSSVAPSVSTAPSASTTPAASASAEASPSASAAAVPSCGTRSGRPERRTSRPASICRSSCPRSSRSSSRT